MIPDPAALALLPLLTSVFTASLLGSLHCAGMCGPFVAVYSAASAGESSSAGNRALLHAAYQGGRAVTYTLVGALAGSLGTFVDWAGEAAGIARFAAIASSCLLILWGVGVLFPRFRIRSPWDGVLGRRLVQLRRRPPLVRASLLGSLTPLLPCGWFYAFALTASGTASVLNGALVMAVFWLGSVPALLGVGAIMNRIGQRLRARIPTITGALLILIGVLGVATRMRHPLDLSAETVQASAGQTVPQAGKVKCH